MLVYISLEPDPEHLAERIKTRSGAIPTSITPWIMGMKTLFKKAFSELSKTTVCMKPSVMAEELKEKQMTVREIHLNQPALKTQ